MRSARRRFSLFGVSTLVLVPAIVLLLHACGREQPVEPVLLGARAASPKVGLTVGGAGSTTGGVITSDRGGISCTISVSGTVVSKSGKCEQQFKTGAIITLTAVPSAGGVITSWTGCTGASESAQSCEVSLDVAHTVNVAFGHPATSFPLAIAGGAGGSGRVTSTPAGVSCTITNGSTGTTGCTATFAAGLHVTIAAVASAGSYLKAWAGAGCDASGTGKGGASGSCVVSMTQAENVVVSFDLISPMASLGQWEAPIAWPAIAIHAHLLPDGRVLTWGTADRPPVLWTPPPSPGAAGSFASVSEPANLFCSGHAFLPDGRLVSTGGHSGINNKGILTTTVFNFANNSWTLGQNMANGRWYPTATTLATGEVLTLSGGDTAQQVNLIPEVIQASGTIRELTSASLYLPYFPMAFVTPTGSVFAAGPSPTTYFLDPAGAGHWTPGPASAFGNRNYGSALMYDAGKILIVGGGTPTATAEAIDLNGALAWHSAGSMAVARRQMNATVLADGKVLATGGTDATGFNTAPTSTAVLAAELWDPATERWTTLSRMTHYRLYHSTALLLPDGRVLSVGSGSPAATGLTDDFTAEIFSPPYLFNSDGTPATRPTISSTPTQVGYAQAFSVQTPAPSSVSKVMWISLASVTHSFNQNQHAVSLTHSVASTSAITVTAPARAALAPPGYYLLFIVDNRGVPSVAKIVRIS
jgi:hypothetical protein